MAIVIVNRRESCSATLFPYCSQMYEGLTDLESAVVIGRIPHILMMYTYYSVYIGCLPLGTHHKPEVRFPIKKHKCRSNPVCISYQAPDACCQ
jgi:hypothetical protein